MATDEVKVKITVDGASAKKELKSVKKEAVDTGNVVESQARGMSTAMAFGMGAVGVAIAAVGKGIQWVTEGFNSASQKAVQFSRARYSSGLDAQSLQKWSNALKIVNGDFSSFNSSLESMNKLLAGKEYGSFSKDKMQAFAELGISPEDYEEPLELLFKTVEELQNIPSARRNILADILGVNRDFLYAAPKALEYMDKLGTLTDEQIRKLEKLDEERNLSSARWERAKEKAGVWASPFFQGLQDFGSFFLESISEEGGGVKDLFFGRDEMSPEGKSNEEKIRSILKKDGWTDTGINALLGNLQEESKLNPGAYNASEDAIGIAQWRLKRKAELQSRPDWKTLEGQMAFLLMEMKRDFPAIYSQMKNATDLGYATSLMDERYEISSGEARGRRLANAGGFAGLSETQTERMLGQYAPDIVRNGGTVNQTNNITVANVEEARQFADNAVGRGKTLASLN